MVNKQRILHRANINEMLQNISSYPLTIVSAPMGYGKTTAVCEYFRKSGARYSWLCLNEASVNCGYFWNQMIQQIPEDLKKWSADLQGFGFPMDCIRTARVVETLSAMFFKEDFSLVLDDYHHAESEHLNQFVEAVAKREIPNLHLVIISRHLPKINMAELIVKNLAIHIGTDHFHFSDQETGLLV